MCFFASNDPAYRAVTVGERALGAPLESLPVEAEGLGTPEGMPVVARDALSVEGARFDAVSPHPATQMATAAPPMNAPIERSVDRRASSTGGVLTSITTSWVAWFSLYCLTPTGMKA